MHGTRAANTALNETDLLMIFGARLDDRVTGEPTRFAPHAKIVHFEIDPAQLDRVRPCEDSGDRQSGRNDSGVSGRELKKHTLPQTSEEWRSRLRAERERAELIPADWRSRRSVFSTNFSAACRKIRVVIADVGQHQMWAAQRYRSSSPRGFITSGGLGAMGFALPAAVGVQLAKPETCVLCVSGDGGFQMNIQELATVHRLGLPVKMVIIDNKYLGMVRQWQQLFLPAQLRRNGSERQSGFRRDRQGLQDSQLPDE